MKVLITGGAGFIGSHTVETLLADGATVRVLDNFSTGKRTNLPHHPHLEIQVGDVRDPHIVGVAMKGMSHVLHLAAHVSVQASLESPLDSCSQNLLGFVTVLNAARIHGVQRFVYASSAAVYGFPEQLPLTEESPVRPMSPYGLEKSVNDQYSELFHTLFGLSTLGLRYFNVYGPRQDPHSLYAGVISKFIACAKRSQPLIVYGDGRQTRDFIYVKDVAAINLRALKSPMTGVCNVASGTRWALLDLIDLLGQILGRALPIAHAPPLAGDIPHSGTRIDRLHRVLGVDTLTSLRDGLTALIEETVGV